MIRNPILPGFNPDPSFCRVGEDYYIATSTFEWYPGVQIHHSRDLVNWTLVSRPLVRKAQLDMRGNPDSCGIWAPCLSHADGKFWLVYTDVKRYGRTTVGGASGASLQVALDGGLGFRGHPAVQIVHGQFGPVVYVTGESRHRRMPVSMLFITP